MRQESKEDYLLAMYRIYEQGKQAGIKSVDIARLLNVSKPSVSEMIRKLAKKEYVKTKPYSNILFTKKGLAEATRITHNHQVIEIFLKKILKYDIKGIHEKSSIHREAHRLEHAFSEESIRRLDRFLNNPSQRIQR